MSRKGLRHHGSESLSRVILADADWLDVDLSLNALFFFFLHLRAIGVIRSEECEGVIERETGFGLDDSQCDHDPSE